MYVNITYRRVEVAKKASKVDGNIAVTNKHTAKLHHVGSFYIYYLSSLTRSKLNCT